MEEIGKLSKAAGRYEFTFPELNLVVRGAYAEWVLEAAGEVISQTERLRAEGKLEELDTLKEFGEVTEIELDSARFETQSRFEAVPQCLVSLGENDYRWVAQPGRDGKENPIQRVHDMSLTRNDSFLTDRP